MTVQMEDTPNLHVSQLVVLRDKVCENIMTDDLNKTS